MSMKAEAWAANGCCWEIVALQTQLQPADILQVIVSWPQAAEEPQRHIMIGTRLPQLGCHLVKVG